MSYYGFVADGPNEGQIWNHQRPFWDVMERGQLKPIGGMDSAPMDVQPVKITRYIWVQWRDTDPLWMVEEGAYHRKFLAITGGNQMREYRNIPVKRQPRVEIGCWAVAW